MTGVLTIGHSSHPIDRFLALLRLNDVTAVADVRSSPFSRHHPQFNRESLKAVLKAAGISYVFLGKELGARSDDPDHYDGGGKVVYERLAASPSYRRGIERVMAGMTDHRVALMCAERDPITCHRTILVARSLEERGVEVNHIAADGSVEPQEVALARLMKDLRIDPDDFFASSQELRARAYRQQEERIAYIKPDTVAAQ